jgi:TonB-dependent receptor
MTTQRRPHPRRTLLAALLSVALAANAQDASVDVYGFDSASGPTADFRVRIDGVEQSPNKYGALRLVLPAGEHQLEIVRAGKVVSTLPLVTKAGEVAELIVNFETDGRATVSLESSAQSTRDLAEKVEIADPGVLEGQVLSAETGKPIAGARVYIAGTPLDLITDADGRFSAQVPGGTYSVSVLAPSFASQTLDAVEVPAKGKAQRNIELTPAGLELAEFVVTEPFVEGSLAAFVEERRTSAAVTDIIGAEQIAKAGDSDAAGALKRVTGLTLVGGKYIYVRGLGERYSAVLVNGAQVPSPDPTRRVVPLDLFPTEILQGVVVQKTYSADMPGEFGGGTIQLRTKGLPEGPFLKMSVGLGGTEGSVFQDGLYYDGGNRDWTGQDDGAREIPDTLDQIRRDGDVLRLRSTFNPDGLTAAEIEAVGEEVSGVYDVEPEDTGLDHSIAISGGNTWQITDDWKVGFIASARHARSFDTVDETRRYFVASSAGLVQRDEIEQRSTSEEIDASGYVAVGVEYTEDHKLRANSILLRQTEDEARVGFGTADNQQLERYLLEWVENELILNQLGGEHLLPWWHEKAQFDWQVTGARANRYAPNTREYRYNITSDGERELSQFGESNRSSWADLVDDSDSFDLNLKLPFAWSDWLEGGFGVHYGELERDRDSYIRRYQFAFAFPNTPAGRAERNALIRLPSLEQIFAPANIRPDAFVLTETTQPTDNYVAQQQLDYLGLSFEANILDRVRINFGYREEDNFQETTTFSVVNPGQVEIGLIDQTDYLPAAAATWWINDAQQLRLGYSRTVSRPDFRELSPAPYVDPILDFTTFGNPDLVTAGIENYDLRWEYYFSPTESFSIAAFRKDFTNPIEKQLLPGSGSILLTLANAESATNQGVEFDIYKHLGFMNGWFEDASWAQALKLDQVDWNNWTVGTNYAWIDSEIQLDEESSGFNTNLQRPLEGQSPYVVNFQLGYQSEDTTREATLLYNVSGERIVQVGVDGQPDVYEQPFGQLDFNYRHKFANDWSMRLRLRNLLDPKVEFLQGDGVLREFTRGRELVLSVEWAPL